MKFPMIAMFVLASLLPTLVQAAVVGDVLVAYNRRDGNHAVMSAADASQYAEVSCGGTPTHGGSPRYFLSATITDVTLPDTYKGTEMVASDEDCERSVILSHEGNMRFSQGEWSPSGRMIAVYATRWDLTLGVLVERGVFVADVTYDVTGRPVGIQNLHLVVPTAGDVPVSWSGDGARLAFRGPGPDGQGGTQSDILVYDLNNRITTNVTNSAGVREDFPSFSPVDDRIVYHAQVAIKGSYRFDVFVIPASGGVAKQLTSKGTTGAPQNRAPSFSPDGLYVVFQSGNAQFPPIDFDIIRIRSDGSGKPVNLTAKRDGDFFVPRWRR